MPGARLQVSLYFLKEERESCEQSIYLVSLDSFWVSCLHFETSKIKIKNKFLALLLRTPWKPVDLGPRLWNWSRELATIFRWLHCISCCPPPLLHSGYFHPGLSRCLSLLPLPPDKHFWKTFRVVLLNSLTNATSPGGKIIDACLW